MRSAGREAATELAEAGGRAGVRGVLEKAAAEGGETLVRKTAALGVEHGPLALRAIGRSPARMVGALDTLPADLRMTALRAVEREPAAMTTLVNQFGGDALEAAARHPGVGATIGGKLGGEGLAVSKALTTDQAVLLGRHADELAALAPAERSGILQSLKASPGKVLNYLETHPKTMWTAAGVAVVIAAKDEVLGPGGVNGKARGLVPQMWHDAVGVVSRPVGMVATGLGVAVLAWAGIKLWGSWRRAKLKARPA
jgi:hypothetical protein